MKRQSVMAAVSLVSVCALAADIVCEWDPANPQTSYADGKVSLTLNGSSVTSLRFDAPGDTVTFTGGELAFATGAQISLLDGSLVFSNDVSSAGNVDVSSGVLPSYSWGSRTATVGVTPVLTYMWTTILPDVDLDELELTSGYLCGGGLDALLEPRNVKRGAGWIECQFKYSAGSGSTTKAVKIRLEQEGADIKAYHANSWYVLSRDCREMDFDNPWPDVTVTPMTRPTASPMQDENRYYCSQINFKRTSSAKRPVLTFAGAFTRGGRVSVSPFAAVRYLDVADIAFDGHDLSGKLTLQSTENGPEDRNATYTKSGYVVKTWQTVATGRTIGEVDAAGIQGVLNGSSIGYDADATVCFVKRESDDVLSFQLQLKSGKWVKGVYVKLRNQNGNVELCPISAHYYAGEAAGESDFTADGIIPANYASSLTTGDYCLSGLTIPFRWNGGGLLATSANAGPVEGGEIEIVGGDADHHAELKVTASTGLPTNGVVTVGAYGVLSVPVGYAEDMARGISGGTCAIKAGPGGKIRQGNDTSFPGTFGGMLQKVELDGGELELGCDSRIVADPTGNDPFDTYGSTYLCNLTLKNGAHVYGKAPRLGMYPTCVWTVGGTSASTSDVNIVLLGGPGTQGTINFEVDDATGNADVDFWQNGGMKMYRQANYQNLVIYKTGSGTMRVCGPTDFPANALRISGGTWMVGSSDTMSVGQNLDLCGGTFATDADIDVTVGSVKLSTSGGLSAGADSTLSLADSSEVEWTPGATLSISCPEGSKVRFGTSSSALTGVQKGALRLNGKGATLDDEGYVVRRGFALIIR